MSSVSHRDSSRLTNDCDNEGGIASKAEQVFRGALVRARVRRQGLGDHVHTRTAAPHEHVVAIEMESRGWRHRISLALEADAIVPTHDGVHLVWRETRGKWPICEGWFQ